ncbi:MAG: hypothetical protein AAFX95_08180 [Cyanobacteria bacterium J06639_16]
MTSPQLLDLTRRIATLTRQDRLRLLWQILKSLLPSVKSTNPQNTLLASALAELQQICTEENYSLEIPNRID